MHAVVFDSHGQAVEVRGEQVATHGVRGSLVQFAGVAEQIDVRERRIAAVLKAVCCHLQLFEHGLLLQGGLLDSLTDLGDGQ
ncbi:hypothetical protein [Microbacterium sp.]|uniref:hypothetical protein n=1 Tax=unclassified Microbacterium TaxID=2609290 RepID=UPI000C454281|nr:hypothetical protein [Microbacterium sp.]MAY50698.1 hypothetical protein [Microbacterium sp.]HBR89659.1 hypothetical protein [Microbacterium sp.]HBS75933.1 hypothetical protein [Microbacterium sp.]